MSGSYKGYGNKICIIIFLLITLFGCNSRTTPAAAGNTKLFQYGTVQSYAFTSTLILNEPFEQKGKDVGFQIQGDFTMGVVWQNGKNENEKLLEFELKGPKLFIRSRKAQTPESFNAHKSDLETAKNFPFLAHWKNGRIINVYFDNREEISIVNLKKGIASLFQFQVLDLETDEVDASGNCQVTYKSLNLFSFSKTKTNCIPSTKVPSRKNPNPILGVNISSSRTSLYKISQDLTSLESITSQEYHELKMLIKKEAGSSVKGTQNLILRGSKSKAKVLKSTTLQEAVNEFEETRKLKSNTHDLQLENFLPNRDKEDCPSLPKLLKENREYLMPSNLGTPKSANAFVKLLSAARSATKEDFNKAFKGSKNKEILAQLCDLAGAIQLPESHEVIMKLINFDSEEDFDKSERYLWSLAIGSHPHEVILRDIFKISQEPHSSEKLSETLILTLGAMVHRFAAIPGNKNHPLLNEIKESILKELKVCDNEICKIKYLRALRNLKCSKTIPLLIKHALDGKKKASVEAIKGLRSFDPMYWTEDVINAAKKIYFQTVRKYDSSSRTLALDILLESDPQVESLQELLLSLTEYEPAFEVKQYLSQRIRQISEKNEKFSKIVNSILKKFRHLFNNYNTQALRGLSTAFVRNFARDEYRNGSLSVVLEISKELLKRGIVDIGVEDNFGKTTSLFTLGLFAGGLGSFVSSDNDKNEENEDDSEEDVANAGMELSVLGAQIRPFIFFNGQGELMGHVWSGTASEKTPAFQALISVIDHLEQIPLQNGLFAQIQVLGAVSFDLSGQIQISLWNRNAQSLVEKNAGISLQGTLRIESSFVKSKVEFNVATKMKLDLQSDLNFYSGTSLCMQLSQPEVKIKHHIHKIEKIPGGKHRLRKSKYSQITVPGRTYALNRKNNEMCNLIFN